MFNAKTRQPLLNLEATLRNWERTIPARAQGFHRLRCRLLEDIGKQLARRFRGIDEASMGECRDRYRLLEWLGPGLVELIQTAEGLETELDTLAQKLADVPELGRLRCEQWRRSLRRLPADCEQAVDLAAARREMARIEAELREHAEALDWVERAERILRTLGSSADTAVLATELPELREGLAAGVGLERVVERLRLLCPPLEARTRASPPPELALLGPLLADIRGWEKKLYGEGEGGDPRVIELSRRHQRLQDEWRRLQPAEVRELSGEARELRNDLAGRAGRIREARLWELEELLADLEQACGPQPKIREALDRLKEHPVDRYQEHEDWLAEFENAHEYFKAIARDHSPALEQRLRERHEALAQGLRELLGRPLADELRQRGELLEAEAETLSGSEETGDLLRALRRSGEFQRRLDDLRGEARSFLEALSQTQLRLRERNDWLCRESGRLGFGSPDFSGSIAALKEGTAHRTLDQAYGLAGELEVRVAEAERGFLEYCRKLLAERLAESGRLLEALEAAGWADATAAHPTPAAIAEASDALPILEAAEAERGRLEARVQAALRAAEEKRARLAALWPALDLPALAPADRDEAAALGLRLAATPVGAAAERLRNLAADLAAAEAFLERRSTGQAGLQYRLARLKTRLGDFNREGMKAFCPEELFHRVSDLTYGIPDPPEPRYLPQLKQAEILLDRIEAQALRVAAETVAGWLALLRRGFRHHPDPDSVSGLLDRIEALGPERPVPAQWRQQIQKALVQMGVEAFDTEWSGHAR